VSGHSRVSFRDQFPRRESLRNIQRFWTSSSGGARWLPNNLLKLGLFHVLFTLKMFSLIRNPVPRAATRVGITFFSSSTRSDRVFSTTSQNMSRRVQAFSTSVPRKADVSKVILVGRLGREPEVKTTKSDKEYVSSVSYLLTPITCSHLLLLQVRCCHYQPSPSSSGS